MSSINRLKERGGAGGKITALNPTKNLSENGQKPNAGNSSCKKSAGKENPRSVSRGKVPASAMKPAIRPLPIQHLDKEPEPRARWSTSSLPKGKSSYSCPSRSLPRDRLSGVSGSDYQEKPLEKPSLEISDKGKGLNGFRALVKCQQKKGNLNLILNAGDEKLTNRSNVCRNKAYLEPISRGVPQTGVRVLDDCKIKTVSCSSMKEDDKSGSSLLKNLGNCKHGSMLLSNSKADVASKFKAASENDVKGVMVLDNCSGGAYLGSKLEELSRNVASDAVPIENCRGKAYFHSNLNGESQNLYNDCNLSKTLVQKPSLLLNLIGDKGYNNEDNVENLKVSSVCMDSKLIGEGEKSSTRLSMSESSGEHRLSKDHNGAQVVNKYPSKLREKLAFLEGKVNKIASEIKRTKEMLDMNNPDASKLILSDIQEKILGIEKDVGNVIDDGKSKLDSLENGGSDGLLPKHVESSKNGQVRGLNASVNVLNAEELEARFFPHHKLLRNRTSLGHMVGNGQNGESNIQESSSCSAVADQLLSLTEDNPIALEFLASLDKNQSKINANDRCVQSECLVIQAMDSTGAEASTARDIPKKEVIAKQDKDCRLTTDENFNDFDEQENKPVLPLEEEIEESSVDQLREIGSKSCTGGWFLSEGESVLLAHSDGSCSFYDITNAEEKAVYKPPAGISHNLWGDCWLIRAPGSDNCSGRYVVAASAGNSLDSGFCSWDFYTKDVQAFKVDDGTSTCNSSSRTVLGSLPSREVYRRSAPSTGLTLRNQQWWYKPCGPLLVSTASCQKVVCIYDIRDGDLVMKWEVQKSVLPMDYSSPLQWRSKGKVVLAEEEGISIWDVSSLRPQPLLSASLLGKKVTALHVNNTDAELGGGIRQRISSSEVEGNDGVFCTEDTICVLDFRLPSGVGLTVAKHGSSNSRSIYSRGDSIFVGSTDLRSMAKDVAFSQVQQFSLRKGKLLATYALPESNAHLHHSTITQVWGNSQVVMGVCGLGLYVFDTTKNEGFPPSFSVDHGNSRGVREVIGPDDLYSPSFDYLASRVLLISRDRPALWRYL